MKYNDTVLLSKLKRWTLCQELVRGGGAASVARENYCDTSLIFLFSCLNHCFVRWFLNDIAPLRNFTRIISLHVQVAMDASALWHEQKVKELYAQGLNVELGSTPQDILQVGDEFKIATFMLISSTCCFGPSCCDVSFEGATTCQVWKTATSPSVLSWQVWQVTQLTPIRHYSHYLHCAKDLGCEGNFFEEFRDSKQ